MTIRDIGLQAVRAMPWLRSFARKVYAALPARLHDTPTRCVGAFFADATTVSFIQIGAFDGVAGDPIRPLVLDRPGWRGALVEPQPDAFETLRRNYAGQSARLRFLNAAVAARSGDRTLYTVARSDPHGAPLPDWADEIASLDVEHIRKHFPGRGIVERTVRTMAFSEVAEGLPGGIVDLVIIDAEGHERAIIESIDFERHRIRFLMYEHKHLSPEDGPALDARLRRAGFTLKPFGRDTIAWRSLRQVGPKVQRTPRSGTRAEILHEAPDDEARASELVDREGQA